MQALFIFILDAVQSTIQIGQQKKKSAERRSRILHEKEYNTGHGIPAIPNEVRGEIRRQPGQPEVQQKPVLYLFLTGLPGWECRIPWPAGPGGLILESIKKLSKAFYSAEGALNFYEMCFVPFWRKTETQNAVLFQIKLIVLFGMSITAIQISIPKRN